MARGKKQNAEDQGHLPEMEPMPKNPRVHTAALRYVKLRNARMDANKQEKAAHEGLLTKMLEEGLESYKYGNVEVHIDNTRKCKVTTESGSTDASDDEE